MMMPAMVLEGGMHLGSLAIILVLVFAGLLLLTLEFFVIPGFGVGGVLGFLALLGGAGTAWTSYGPGWGVAVFLLSSVVSLVLLIVSMRSNAVKKRFVLSAQQPHGAGTESEDLSFLLGKPGVTRSDLRPAGIADVDDRRVDVESEGGYISQGTNVTVVLVEGPRIVVATTDNAERMEEK